jgi:alkanesulfonate monooxygenase SsuD/methylene tetrahydromethanopterin reductase-like flavin-dependent oxidoreductase (luciferase family)
MTGPRIGVVLASSPEGPSGRSPVREAARHAEDLGLDSVWVGDHLLTGRPVLESTITLATAAAVTDRVAVGLSVFVPAMRPLVWAAKQLATLQVVSGGRLIVGVGSGGPGPDDWEAAGVPAAERGRRTDLALERLPGLLAGEPTRLGPAPDAPVVTLAPAVPRPPIWVGGMSGRAIRRAAAHGDAWFPSLIGPETVTAGAARLHELAEAAGRPAPTVAVGATSALGPAADAASVARSLVGAYGLDPDMAMAIPLTGSPARAAERALAYAEAGANHLVVGASGPDWRSEYEQLAEVRRLLGAHAARNEPDPTREPGRQAGEPTGGTATGAPPDAAER